MTSADDVKIFERSGERQIVTRFSDGRLVQLFGQVWNSLPAWAHDNVYDALGEGEHILLVTDTKGGNKNFGWVIRLGAHIRMFLSAGELERYSDRWCRYVVAHELAHIVRGHLGPPRDVSSLPLARLLDAMSDEISPRAWVANKDHSYDPSEAEADGQAVIWGYPAPELFMRDQRMLTDLGK